MEIDKVITVLVFEEILPDLEHLLSLEGLLENLIHGLSLYKLTEQMSDMK